MKSFFFHTHRPKDPTEERIRALFGFLTEDYDFQYRRTDLGNYTDRNGKLLFCGPYLAYSFYNSRFCLNILYLEQREDYSVTVTEAFCPDGKALEAGAALSDYYAYHLPPLRRRFGPCWDKPRSSRRTRFSRRWKRSLRDEQHKMERTISCVL